MRVADYVAQFISSRVATRVYGVCGAGAMHLNDAFANCPGLKVIAMQHEQAAAMAAEAEARVTNRMSVVSVTTGPGATNAVTGVACAYVDSIPMLVIGGQVTRETMINDTGTRQIGMNELDGVAVMKPVTKLAFTVFDPFSIRASLERAVHVATTGRMGPVFVEIPLDVQAAQIDETTLEGYTGPTYPSFADRSRTVDEAIEALAQAERPVIIVGNGVRLSGAVDLFVQTVSALDIPVVSSWGGADIMPADHPSYIGRCGIFGDRASNFAVQSADLILAIGTRLAVGQIGHNPRGWAPNAKKIVVDIDYAEGNKPSINADIRVFMDAKNFLEALSRNTHVVTTKVLRWLAHCRRMRTKYGVTTATNDPSRAGINSYVFMKTLEHHLPDDAIVVTDVGFCYIPAFQTLRLKGTQRLIHSHGVSPMGWGIPAAIGAAFATGKNRPIICLVGDGGAMMNLQELQTIAAHKLPISIFIFENGGYATMKIAQNNHFKREVMAGPDSGMTLPDFAKIARAFMYTFEFNAATAIHHSMEHVFDISAMRPVAVVMHMDQKELISPRLMARLEDGKFVPAEYADMWPHLPREEYEANLNLKGVADVVERLDERRQKILASH